MKLLKRNFLQQLRIKCTDEQEQNKTVQLWAPKESLQKIKTKTRRPEHYLINPGWKIKLKILKHL